MNVAESRAFDYFVHKAAPVLAGSLDNAFWKVILPQISLSDGAVRYAILAIGQLFERNTAMPDLSSEWYAKSLTNFASKASNTRHNDETTQMLLSCVLFTSIEFQRYNVLNACKLLRHGHLMIGGLDVHSMDDTSRTVVQMLQRQRMLLMMYGHYPSGISFNLPPLIQETPRDHLVWAREELFDCMFHIMRLVLGYREAVMKELSEMIASLLAEQPEILMRLQTWYSTFTQKQSDYHFQEKIAAMTLLIYYEIAVGWASTYTESEFVTD